MKLYARNIDNDSLTLIAEGRFTAKGAWKIMDDRQRMYTWPLSDTNFMHIAVVHCAQGWYWLSSANMADVWMPGEGTLEQRLVESGYRAANPLPVPAIAA